MAAGKTEEIQFNNGEPVESVALCSVQTAAKAQRGRTMKGHQTQITLALPLDLLERVDMRAGQLSISRAAFMKMAIARAVEAEV